MQPQFDGADYVPARDDARLTNQLKRVFSVISNGHWYTLATISELTGDPAASVSAQLRHLRKERFGAHTITKKHVGGGLYVYRLELTH